MEEIKRQLQSWNSAVQRRAVLKLLKLISKSSKETIGNLSKLPEIQLLCEQCEVGTVTASSLCIAALGNLAISEQVDAVDILKCYLSIIPSTKNVSLLLHGMISLWLHVRLKNPVMHGDYLIDVLKLRPDCITLFLEKILHFLRDSENSSKHFLPVLKYIWLSPVNDISVDSLSYQVSAKFADGEHINETYGFFLDILLKLQLRTSKDLQFSASLLKLLSNSLHLCGSEFFKNDNAEDKLSSLLLLCLATYEKGLCAGNDCILFLDTASEIARSVSQQKSTFYGNCAYLLASYLLTKATGPSTSLLMNIIAVLLNQKDLINLVAFGALLPVLHLQAGVDLQEKELASTQILVIQKTESLNRHEGFERPTLLEGLQMLSETCYEVISTTEAMLTLESLPSHEAKILFLEKLAEQDILPTKSKEFVLIFITSVIRQLLGYQMALHHLFKMLFKVLDCDPGSSVQVLPFILYCLNKEQDPTCKFDILSSVPCFGKYKPCIASVLSTLHLLSTKNTLKAQTLRYMAQLWKENQRTFPFLHKLLLSLTADLTRVNPEDLKLEISTSIAATVRDVCDISPSGYGPEVLVPLSALLRDSKDQCDIPSSAMALQGMYSLCAAEVVDIRTVWKVLEPHLKESRPMIVKNIFRILSLVPSLSVPTADYDRFMEKILVFLWQHVSNLTCSLTVGAAYKSLSKFSPKMHTLKLIPAVAKAGLKLPPHLVSTPLDLGKNPEEVLNYVPGDCYIKLLQSIADPVILKKFGEFLKSLVEDEVRNLPRSIYSRAFKAARLNPNNQAVSQIPSFLCSHYEANRLPAMRGSMAVGVLFSYEPPTPAERDPATLQRSLVDNVQFCERVLESLLQDVLLDVSKWNMVPLIPAAWISFVEVVFNSCREGRQAELDMLPESGTGGKDVSAWILARDSLVEAIKTGMKGKSSSHANGVLALTGLILAVKNFNDNLQGKNTADDWLTSAVETVVCIAVPERDPEHSVFSWLLKNPSKPSYSGSGFIQGCALLCLSHLLPLLSSDMNLIQSLLQSMAKYMQLDKKFSAFYGGLALGMFVASLCKLGFSELKDADGKSAYVKYVLTMEESFSVKNDEDIISSGPLVGLVIIITALSQYGSNSCHQLISDLCFKLRRRLMNINPSTMSYDVIAFATSAVYASAACSKIIPMSEVESLTVWLVAQKDERPTCSGTALSLGVLLQAQVYLKADKADLLYDKITMTWMSTLLSKEQATLSRLSALNGLMSAFSGALGLCSFLTGSLEEKTAKLNDVVKEIMTFMRSSKDAALLGTSSWFLGLIFYNSRQNKSALFVSTVSSYSYLNDESLLKPIISWVLQATLTESDLHTQVCLESLAAITSPLPPINWGSVLSTFLFTDAKPELSVPALRIVLNQMPTSVSALALFTTCITVPNADSLPTECRKFLIEALPNIAETVQPSVLQLFLNNVVIGDLRSAEKSEWLLDKISETMGTMGISETNRYILYDTVTMVMAINMTKKFSPNDQLLSSLTHCVGQLPDKFLDDVVANSGPFGVVLRCSLVRVHRKPLSWLVPVIESLVPDDEDEFLQFLHWCCSVPHPTRDMSSWLLDMIGRSNYLLHTKLLDKLVFLVKAFTVSVLSWTSPFPYEKNVSLWKLSGGLSLLLSTENFSSFTSKILEWLLTLSACSVPELFQVAHQCLWSLRHTKEFSDPRIWTKIL